MALAVGAALRRLLPFRVTARLLGRTGAPSDAVASAAVAGALGRARAVAVGRAVERMARRVPWTANCLTTAIAARLMLARRRVPSVTRFGMAAKPGRIEAHAWLEVDGVAVTGGAEADGFVPVAAFTAGIRPRPS